MPLDAACCATIVAIGVPVLNDSSLINSSRSSTTALYARTQTPMHTASSSGTRQYVLSFVMTR